MTTEQPHICPNCDQEFDKNHSYCPHCGQKNHKQRIKLKHFVSDYLSANFNFDSKVFLTLKLLLFKPAFLTKEFFKGRQTKYIPPVRLYLFISLAYFFVLALTFPSINDLIDDNSNDSAIDSNYKAQEMNLNIDSTGFSINYTEAEDSLENDTNESVFSQYITSKMKLMDTKVGMARFFENIKKYISTGMFLLLPFVAFILSMLFYKKKFYIEHLLFVVQLQSVIFIIGILFNLIEFIYDPDWFLLLKFFILVFISFLWFKNYYELSIKKTIWKLSLFYIGHSILFIIYFVLILFTSILFI